MYKVCSIFSQVLKLFSRGEFEKAVKEHKAERHARGFTSWGQFMAMLFCQLGRAHSLREICGGLACCEGQLKHLGVPVAPKKSTLAYANEKRPWELYQTVFEQRCRCGRAAWPLCWKRKLKTKSVLEATVRLKVHHDAGTASGDFQPDVNPGSIRPGGRRTGALSPRGDGCH